MRPIDADALNTAVAVFMAENAYLNMTALDALKMVAGWISEAPTIGAVPVVRCRECIYCSWQEDNLVYCDNFERDMMPDDFCSVGEPKEADHEVSEP